MEKARLSTITDNYGNQYRFTYAPNEVSIVMPDNRKTTVYYNDQGIIRIDDPLSQQTKFAYIEQEGQTLIHSIETPEGLLTKVDYSAINYKNNGTKKIPVVIILQQIDLASYQTLKETHYNYLTDKNFTGFPEYSLSSSGDSLMDSNDRTYRYVAEVKESDLIGEVPQFHKKVYYYNYLHLPTEIRTLKEDKRHLKTTFLYDISPFKYSRSTNYDKPVEIINWIWNEDHGRHTPSDKVEFSYDLFGNKNFEKRWVYDKLSSQWKVIQTKRFEFYTDHFGLKKLSIMTDELTQQSIRKQFSLENNCKTHSSKYVEVKSNKKSPWEPWQSFTLRHDDFGRLIYQAKQWVKPSQPGINKTWKKIDYHFNSKNSLLNISTTSALEALSKRVIDTRNNLTLQRINPTRDSWKYSYDPLGRLTNITNPLGNSVTHDYKTFQADQVNQKIRVSALGYQSAIQTDALGRSIGKSDKVDGSWRVLGKQKYNGWGQVIQKTNVLNQCTQTAYDDQKRPVDYLDSWGNKRHIDYCDVALKTITYETIPSPLSSHFNTVNPS